MHTRVAIICGMAFEAEIVRRNPWREPPDIIYGLDTHKLLADIERAVENGATHLISFGTAAGLDPALVAGTIVLATSIYFLNTTHMHSPNPAWLETDSTLRQSLSLSLHDAVQKPMAGLDNPITHRAEKQGLWESIGVCAADMESHHVANIAAQHKITFSVLRVVLDDAQTALPHAATVATKPDGTIAHTRLLCALLKNPLQIPAMLRLGQQHSLAKAALVHGSRCLCESLNGRRY